MKKYGYACSVVFIILLYVGSQSLYKRYFFKNPIHKVESPIIVDLDKKISFLKKHQYSKKDIQIL